ncbi:hypothetical protein L2E82_15955 [Cichorium intybus]|uniref:Uncharacterized protein n=1 Tax=Cichorium intybus TaxID=13427 RepID=A0ACB9F3Q3_CICIN|nr:hypothetical protein L2E82_15955 [Cichorium intybus]
MLLTFCFGFISLLAAVDALSQIENLDTLSKQLVFVVFTREAWGYLGSRRFLHELDQHTDAVNGINSTLIETVIEVGSVGKCYNDDGVKTFYAHTTGVSSATNETLDALQKAQDSLGTIFHHFPHVPHIMLVSCKESLLQNRLLDMWVIFQDLSGISWLTKLQLH